MLLSMNHNFQLNTKQHCFASRNHHKSAVNIEMSTGEKEKNEIFVLRSLQSTATLNINVYAKEQEVAIEMSMLVLSMESRAT